MKTPRVALVHDWLTGMRGGEYVLDAIAELFVSPELFTLIRLEGSVAGRVSELPCTTTWLQRVPGAGRYYRHFLPLMPSMIDTFDLADFDLVVSSSHCVAKGVRKARGAVHVSYVHAPMRYMWDRYDDYFGKGRASFPVRVAARAVRPYLRSWDRSVSSPERIDLLIANSAFTADQLRRAYGREPSVVHPFAEVERFTRPRAATGEYLVVGAFAPNKRVDLAIQAFNRMRLPLLVVGKGQDEAMLRAMAGPTITFLGAVSNAQIDELYARARGFIFPGVEDFGITPLEAMASGLPVIAYGVGGAMETVIDGESGLLFHEPTVDSLVDAVQRLESGAIRFDEHRIRARGRAFTKPRFQSEVQALIRAAWSAAGKRSEDLERTFGRGPLTAMAGAA